VCFITAAYYTVCYKFVDFSRSCDLCCKNAMITSARITPVALTVSCLTAMRHALLQSALRTYDDFTNLDSSIHAVFSSPLNWRSLS
jgi:hypothetical protein